MADNIIKMNFAKIDDLFTTENERKDNSLDKVVNIDLDNIENFPNHPFKVLENQELYNLRDSIIDKGVISPILVRPKSNGKYEIISGHRRKYASELANKSTIPCIIRDLSDDEAIIAMVDSNLQREHILPSEKAFAYKMKLEAEKHQGKRSFLTSCQIGTGIRSDEKLAKQVNESARQIQRYIRLTNLISPILKMVDEEKLGFNTAVEISYITHSEQQMLLDSMEDNLSYPTLSQAQEIKSLSKEGLLSMDKIDDILSREKPNQVEKLKIEMRSLKSKMPKSIPITQYKEYIFKALDYYNKHLQRNNSRER